MSKAINGLICDNVDFSKFGVRGIDTQKRDREQCTQRHPEILIEDDDSEDTEDSELIDYNDYEDSDEEEEDFEEEEDYIEDIRTRLCDTCSCVKQQSGHQSSFAAALYHQAFLKGLSVLLYRFYLNSRFVESESRPHPQTYESERRY